MVGVLAVGFVANLLIRPVAERFHEKQTAAAEGPERDEATLETLAPSSGRGSSSQGRLVLSWLLVVAAARLRRRADADHGGQAVRLTARQTGRAVRITDVAA